MQPLGPIGITFALTLPLGLMAALAVLFPRALTPRRTLSQRRLALSVALTVVGLVLAGMLLFADLYARQGAQIVPALRDDTGATLVRLFWASLQAAIVWGPVLALTWLVMAQAVEKRRGQDAARKGKP